MSYKIGDKVRIKSIDWYNENKDVDGFVYCGNFVFDKYMSVFCGSVVTISWVYPYNKYDIQEDIHYRTWTDEMIEGLVEEGTTLNKRTGLKVELELSKSVIGVSNVESLHGERFMSGFVKAIIPPEGYIFKDENGNVINATKIVLEKKEKEYPKSYEECCMILQDACMTHKGGYKGNVIQTLQKLLICRDAYWKIAGEEMGLGKPWEPDWTDDNAKYSIYTIKGVLTKAISCYDGAILAFPTEEMRDAFYEHFKELIEQCKELL